MKNKTLHLIEPEFDFGLINSTSTLLTSIDTPLTFDEYHTSVGDIDPNSIIKIADDFSTINFVKENWDFSSPTYKETVILLNYFSWFKNVTNFSRDPMVLFNDIKIKQRPDSPVLWVFGCSHSHGVGLLPGQQNFGDVVSESLGLPLMLVSRPGSSLSWSTKNLMAADIRSEDTVIWQITTPHRVSRHDGEVQLSASRSRALLEVFDDQQIFFDHVNLIKLGVAYLRKTKAKFSLCSILNQNDMFYDYLIEYSKYPEYCHSPGVEIDKSFDNLHSGPLSHKALAQRLLNHIQCTNA
jgi:hypothetical protein